MGGGEVGVDVGFFVWPGGVGGLLPFVVAAVGEAEGEPSRVTPGELPGAALSPVVHPAAVGLVGPVVGPDDTAESVLSEVGSSITSPGDEIEEGTSPPGAGALLGDPGLSGDATTPSAASTR